MPKQGISIPEELKNQAPYRRFKKKKKGLSLQRYMEIATASSSSLPPSAATESLLRALTSRGWCFGDVDQVKALIATQLSFHGARCTVGSIESELVNMDLRSIGGKCLPEASVIRKASHIQGPKVLQIASTRDISRSMSESSGNSDNHRLLRLKLTDGHSEITAIEYTHVSSFSGDVIPGTKVLLQNKAEMRGGIVCLNDRIITLLGGIVQSLYEEWQMKNKYTVNSLSTSRILQKSAEGPPPFEKLQIQAPTQRNAGFSQSSPHDSGRTLFREGESSKMSQTVGLQKKNPTMDSEIKDAELPDNADNKEKPANSDTRLKVAASVPVQNQVAAQKLLQKKSQSDYGGPHSRGQRHRRKGQEEDSPMFTLDEWERRKTGINLPRTDKLSDINQDEDLARELQRQFDLEDIHEQKDPHMLDAEDIKKSMFNFQRDDTAGFSGTRGRGRGRGRGRRSRGRG